MAGSVMARVVRILEIAAVVPVAGAEDGTGPQVCQAAQGHPAEDSIPANHTETTQAGATEAYAADELHELHGRRADDGHEQAIPQEDYLSIAEY